MIVSRRDISVTQFVPVLEDFYIQPLPGLRGTPSTLIGCCLLALLLVGEVEARGELAVSHLLGEARAVKIVQAQGGAIRFTAEARIGAAGDWVLGTRRLPGDRPTVAARFDWPNGLPVPFLLRSDGRRTVSLSLGPGSHPSTVAYESDGLAGLDQLFVSALAVDTGTSINLAGLKLDGKPVRDAPAAASAGAKGQDVLRIQDGRLAHGFTLAGTITLSWRGAKPQGSNLRALFWGAGPAAGKPAEVRITAPKAESVLPTGTPAITAAFSTAGPALDPAAVVLLLDGADRTGQAAVTASGLAFTPSTRLLEGKHTVQVIVRDRAGGETRAAVSFTTDTVPPAIAFASPPTVVTDNPAPVIRLTYSDSTSGLEPGTLRVTLDGESIDSICVANLASGVCLPASIAEGSHTLKATVRDRAGNAGTASFGFTLTLSGGNP